MRYYNPPPPVDLPKFMYRAYPEQIFESLVTWADAEYRKALQEATRKGRAGVIRVLAGEWSGMRVLSELEGFRWLCANLDEASWRRLSRKTRKFLTGAFEWYELTRTTTVNP